MSEANIKIVRRVYDAAARRDRASVLALYDSEVDLDLKRVPVATLMGRTTYHGHDGLQIMFRDWYEAFEGYEEDVEELIDAGQHVVAVITGRGRGRASGTDVEAAFIVVWTILDGKVVRLVWYPTREAALAAVGLEE